MKTLRLFAFAAIAGAFMTFSACSDDDDNNTGEQVVRGDKACRIESIKFVAGTDTISGDVYDYDKSIDVAYLITQLIPLKTATAIVTLSDGATITPDPSQVTDYSVPVTFTVTAKDGTTKRSYTTKPAEKVVETYVKLTSYIDNVPSALGISGLTKMAVSDGNPAFATATGIDVYSRVGMSKLGSANLTGVTGSLSFMTNDEKGHLVAAYTSNGAIDATPVTFYCWKNGWDQAPEVILGPSTSAIGGYISVSGDLVNGKSIITAVGGRSASGAHFCWTFENGVRKDYYGTLLTNNASNDGNWGQQVGCSSGEITDPWFMWDAVAGGQVIGTWSDWDGSAAPSGIALLSGTTGTGPHSWGNYTVGIMKAFNFNEKAYCLAFTAGWPSAYISIVDNNGEFLLNSADASIAASAGTYSPSCTFWYNEADGCGYAYVLVQDVAFKVWKLEVAIL